jgi:hypothetical protein
MHTPPSTREQPRLRDVAAAFVGILLVTMVLYITVPALVVPTPDHDPAAIPTRLPPAGAAASPPAARPASR